MRKRNHDFGYVKCGNVIHSLRRGDKVLETESPKRTAKLSWPDRDIGARSIGLLGSDCLESEESNLEMPGFPI